MLNKTSKLDRITKSIEKDKEELYEEILKKDLQKKTSSMETIYPWAR